MSSASGVSFGLRASLLAAALVLFGAGSAQAQCTKQDYCCGNKICDPGEDRATCAEDCKRGCNLDYVCEANKGETEANCSDCAPLCFPQGCNGRCGLVPDGCGGSVSCPKCQPACPHPNNVCEPERGEDPDNCPNECDERCGNTQCEKNEHFRCPSDCPAPACDTETCAAGCPRRPTFKVSEAKPRAGEPITLTAFPDFIEGAKVDWDFGDGEHCRGCDRTLTHIYAAARPEPYVVRLTATENRCHKTRESYPQYLSVQPGQLACANPNNVCEPDKGEDFLNCPGDCDEKCGVDGCQAGEHFRCPSDCPPPPCTTTKCGGVCAPRPTFTLSNPYPLENEPVAFTAFPNFVEGPQVNWDFGDGVHCDGCARTATHAYAKARKEPYVVRLTATENVCHSPQLSHPQYIVVKPFAQLVGDAALVLYQDFPKRLERGQSYEATVTLQNIGTTPWEPGLGYKLGASGDRDPFTKANRVPLLETVPPMGTFTFKFTLSAGECSRSSNTQWQMLREGYHRFGGVAIEYVDVPGDPLPGCTLDGVSGFACDAQVEDGYEVDGHGQPVSGVRVDFTLMYRDEVGEFFPILSTFGTTGENGRLTLTLATDLDVDLLECVASPKRMALRTRAVRASSRGSHLPTGTVVSLNPEVAPEPTDAEPFRGLKDGDGVARLYQSGAYDKVVVIPEGFDFGEQDDDARVDADRFWFQFKEILQPLYKQGYDVWLFEPFKTGQNIHEQAAEFAQAIQHAAGYRGGALGGKVVVGAYSLGGVVARVATARWEADPDWRSSLGLPPALPVRLLAFGDAPLRGANANTDLQGFLWQKDREGRFNLNTCAAQQLLQRSCQGKNVCSITNYQAFFELGTAPVFTSGLCDYTQSRLCVCDPGPPVFGMNGDGFAHVPKVAFAVGSFSPDFNQCYGGAGDRDVSGEDVCPRDPGGDGPFRPFPGNVFLNLRVEDCPGQSKAFPVTAQDVQAGSRFASLEGEDDAPPGLLKGLGALLFYGICFSGNIDLEQNFPFTFIPVRSALAGDNPAAVPFGAEGVGWKQNDHQGIHNDPPRSLIKWLIGKIGDSFGAASPAGPAAVARAVSVADAAEPVSFDGTASEAGDTGVRTSVWDFGDGTLGVGASAQREYTSSGTYAARLTVADDQGAVDVASLTVRVGHEGTGEGNRVPELSLSQETTCTADGCTAAFSVSGHDADGDTLAYSWDGCASGGGGNVTCKATSAGVLRAFVTARDGKGAVTTRGAAVVVYPSAFNVGDWGACRSTDEYVCTAAGADGCRRAGTRLRTVAETAWTVDPEVAAERPTNEENCTLREPGYVESYTSAYASAWTCAAAGANGCFKDRVSYTAATFKSASPDAAQPAVRIYTTGYVSAWTTGAWSGCSASCGSGTKTRSVTASAFKPDAPSVTKPASSQSCNTQSCAKTCADYSLYSRRPDCLNAGWAVCEIRYKDNNVGGLLSCWKGFE